MDALPVTRQSTRFTRLWSSNATTCIPKRSRTVTYQRSFFIRAFCTWHVLQLLRPSYISLELLCASYISLASFKRSDYFNIKIGL